MIKRAVMIFTCVSAMNIAASSIAHADTLSGVLWGGIGQRAIVCYLFNPSSISVSIISKSIYSENGAARALAFNGCGTFLNAGRTCAFGANVLSTSGASACKAVFPSGVTAIRGEMEARTSPGVVLSNVELR